MISQIFFTNIVLIVCCTAIDGLLNLKLEKTVLNPLLNLWVVLTVTSVPTYIVWLIWR